MMKSIGGISVENNITLSWQMEILSYQVFPLHAPCRVDVHLLNLCEPSLHQVMGNFRSLGRATYLTLQQVY